MSRLDWVRCFIHLPVGCVAALLTWGLGGQGIIFSVGFMFYEALEDWKISDCSYKDMFGFLIGYGVTSGCILISQIF